jgi:hypothetical protein
VTGEWRKLHNEELIYTHPQILLADQIKENKVGRTCGTHWRGQKVYRVLVGESPKEGDHLEDEDVDGRMGSEWILGKLTGYS